MLVESSALSFYHFCALTIVLYTYEIIMLLSVPWTKKVIKSLLSVIKCGCYGYICTYRDDFPTFFLLNVTNIKVLHYLRGRRKRTGYLNHIKVISGRCVP